MATKVSVVIPVYNQAAFIGAAVHSVLTQDYEDLELIVVNDGSSDGVEELLASIPGIRVISQTNRGAAAALNVGLRAATGDLVCWLSADDEFLPGKVERQVQEFASDPSLAMSYMGYETMDAFGTTMRQFPETTFGHPDPFVAIFHANSVNGSSVMLRRGLLDEVGYFDETLRADVDGDMWLRISQQHRIAGLAGVWIRYRVHQNTLSADVGLMRQSMSQVRLPYVGNGVLEQRVLAADGVHAGSTLADIARTLARSGMTTLARETLAVARRQSAPRSKITLAHAAIAQQELLQKHPSLRGILTRLGPLRRARI